MRPLNSWPPRRPPGHRPGDSGVAEIARLCGYLPLAIGMLARQLHHHPSWTPAGLAAELAAARDRLELMHAEDVSVAAAFDLSYQDLTPDQQRLFRRPRPAPRPRHRRLRRRRPRRHHPGQRPAAPGRPLRPAPDHRAGPGPVPAARPAPRSTPRPSRPATTPPTAGGRHRSAAGLLSADRTGRQQPNLAAPTGPPLPSICHSPGHRNARPPVSTPGQAAAWLETERANLHASVGYAAGK